MKLITPEDYNAVLAFAERAKPQFEGVKNTYTDGDIKAGCFFAVKFGVGDDCILVFKLAYDFEPINLTHMISRAK